jgi:hypothetical protein
VGAIDIVGPNSVLDCRILPQNVPILAAPTRVRCTGAEFVLLVEKVATSLAWFNCACLLTCSIFADPRLHSLVHLSKEAGVNLTSSRALTPTNAHSSIITEGCVSLGKLIVETWLKLTFSRSLTSTHTLSLITMVLQEAVFSGLIDSGFLARYPEAILVTGKGQPDVRTRRLLNAIHREVRACLLGNSKARCYSHRS